MMFRFKDSNFYLNQKCIPHYAANDLLFDGTCVKADHEAETVRPSGGGEYIVMSEGLNRDTACTFDAGIYIGRHDLVGILPFEKARIYKLSDLVGVEFVTDYWAYDGPSVFADGMVAGFDASDGTLVGGTIGNGAYCFDVISHEHGITTLVLKRNDSYVPHTNVGT